VIAFHVIHLDRQLNVRDVIYFNDSKTAY